MTRETETLEKAKVYKGYQQLIGQKVFLLQQKLQDLIESTRNETKSSAGDKYETGRAMLQIEQDNVRKQLKEVLDQKAAFEMIDKSLQPGKIVVGSLVKTDKGYFLISVGLGKLSIDNIQVIAISPQSPLGTKLLGLKAGDIVTVVNTCYSIERVD